MRRSKKVARVQLTVPCRPICSNCTKSKRFCEGYNPRIGFRQPPTVSEQTEGAFSVRPPLLSHFASFEGYPSAPPRLDNGGSASLRPIRPTPLHTHQRNYNGVIDASCVIPGAPMMPALTPDAFAANPVPFPLSADALGTFQQVPHHLYGDGTRAVPHSPLQRHASVSGVNPGVQTWSEGFPPQQVQSRDLLTRSNTLASYDPMVGASTAPLPAREFPSLMLSSGVPASQFSPPMHDGARLTSTQLAAFDGQPLPSDHPFYLDATAQVGHGRFELTSNGESNLSMSHQRLSNSITVMH